MNVLNILQYPDARLRQPAEEVTEFDEELKELVTSMVLTCSVYRAHGLAAPQVGVSKRVYVSMSTEGEPEVYINPEIVDTEGKQKMLEGCLSFPDVYEVVERAEEVTVKYWDVEGEEHQAYLEGLEAVAAQHEIDHLDGILYIDKVSPLKRRLMLKKLKKTKKLPKLPSTGVPSDAKRKKARNERKRQRKHRKSA